MEMSELERAWSGMEKKLAEQGQALRRMESHRRLDNIRARLRLLSVSQWMQLAFGLLIVFWGGGYWWDHWGTPHLVAYGMGIHAYGLGLLVFACLQLTRIFGLDYRQPVLETQRQLLGLRKMRILTERVLLPAGMVAWVPMLFVLMRRVGIDVWLTRPAVVWWNLAAGVAMALLFTWLMRRFPALFDSGGVDESLRRAANELAEIEHGD
jgi:hypothetical protein